MADPKASLTVKLDVPAEHRWSGTFPVEVRNSDNLILTATGVSDGRLEVPAGRYFVTASLPNGQQATVDDIVDLQPGDDKQVRLSVSDLDFPATLENTTTLRGSFKEFVRPITRYFTAQNVAILRGNWLAAVIDPKTVASVSRQPTTRSSIEIGFSDVNAWIEIAASDGCSYLAVPVDENRSTTMQWHLDPKTSALELKFDFNDGELNSFFDFVHNGQSFEARSISRSIIVQSEQYMVDKRRSPLTAILGAYVLLRANELDGMDVWTDNLVNWFTWLPDALAIRVEYLARVGAHSAALRQLLDVPKWGTPWIRSGVAYLENRAKLYVNVADPDRTDGVTDASRTVLGLGPDDLKKIRRIADVFSELASALDMTQTVTALHGLWRVS